MRFSIWIWICQKCRCSSYTQICSHGHTHNSSKCFKVTRPEPTNLWFQFHGLECLEWQEVCSEGEEHGADAPEDMFGSKQSNEIAGVLDGFHFIKDGSSANRQEGMFFWLVHSVSAKREINLCDRYSLHSSPVYYKQWLPLTDCKWNRKRIVCECITLCTHWLCALAKER